MSYHYTYAAHESAPYSLPNIEVFWVDEGEWWYDENGERCDPPSHSSGEPCDDDCKNRNPASPGFYFWYCLPGCLPDSEPLGPYETEGEALEAARELAGDEE